MSDIYADPVISRVATTYPTNKSIITIPKVELVASVKNSDGTTSKYPMPRAQYLIRTKAETLNILSNQSNNLFELSAGFSTGEITNIKARVNQRYFLITQLEAVGDSGGATDTTTVVALNLRPDARGQLHKEFQFIDSQNNSVTATLIGHVDWDSGNVQYSVTFSPVSGYSFTCNYVICKCVFSPKTGDVGRVKISIKVSGWDRPLSPVTSMLQ